jgi:SPP1 family predicted phage head-tail adaptor
MPEKNVLVSHMRHRITLQQPQLLPEEGGSFAIVWHDLATVWAGFTPIESRSYTTESVFAEQVVFHGRHQVILRYRNDVTTEMRIAFSGRYFNIRSIVNVGERGEMLRLLVEENTAT